MKLYWKRLCGHPGVPAASAFTIMGIAAGARDGGMTGGIGGAVLMGLIVWAPVLITARAQPLEHDHDA